MDKQIKLEDYDFRLDSGYYYCGKVFKPAHDSYIICWSFEKEPVMIYRDKLQSPENYEIHSQTGNWETLSPSWKEVYVLVKKEGVK